MVNGNEGGVMRHARLKTAILQVHAACVSSVGAVHSRAGSHFWPSRFGTRCWGGFAGAQPAFQELTASWSKTPVDIVPSDAILMAEMVLLYW